MNQLKTGRFIAEMRRERGLTQRQLAEALNISNKTVSKWECGNGMPEISVMLPLCQELGISVNELLSGERLTDTDYRERAEENMMDLVRVNQESKKKLAVSIIVGVESVVAVLALVLLAALLDLPAAARIALIALAVAELAAGIAAASIMDREAGVFVCPKCQESFVPTMKAYVGGAHTLTHRRLTCPACGQTSMCRHRIIRTK